MRPFSGGQLAEVGKLRAVKHRGGREVTFHA